MQNVLMLTPYLPYPPVSGGRSRTFNLIKHLAGEFKFTLLCFGRPEEQVFDLSSLREFADVIVLPRASSPSTLKAAFLSLTNIQPITMKLYGSPEFRETLRQLLRKRLFDAIHIESFYMMQNLPWELNLPPVLLSEPAIEYIAWGRHARVAQPILQRPAVALEALKMRYFEPQWWRRATLIGAMSEVDAKIIRQRVPEKPIAITPNGVDVDYFTPQTSTPRDPDNAVFMGDYKYFPNTDAALYFIREIMPRIRAERPNFTLTLLGKDPTPELLEIGTTAGSGVKVEGLVEDTRPYLLRAALFVCPLRSGSGTRFKLLESLACGLPVVSTTLGAEGLDATNDRHMIIADTPDAFASAVIRLLKYPDEAMRLGRYGRNWVNERHSWRRSAALLADAYHRVIGSEDMTIPSPMGRRARRRDGT